MVGGKVQVGEADLIGDGLVQVALDSPSLKLDVEAVRAIRAAAIALAKGPYAVVVDARAVAYVDREAREWLATSPENAPIAAAIVADAPVVNFLVELQAGTPRVRPIAVFEAEQVAIAWAMEELESWRAANPHA